MYKIRFKTNKTSKGEDVVYCNTYSSDKYVVQPLNKNGFPMCTIFKTNIISITKDN